MPVKTNYKARAVVLACGLLCVLCGWVAYRHGTEGGLNLFQRWLGVVLFGIGGIGLCLQSLFGHEADNRLTAKDFFRDLFR